MKMRRKSVGGLLFAAAAILTAMAATAYACTVTMGGVQHDMQITPNTGSTLADTPVVVEGHCLVGFISCPNDTGVQQPIIGDALAISGPCTPTVGSVVPGSCPDLTPGVNHGHTQSDCGSSTLLGSDGTRSRVDVPGVGSVQQFTAQGTITPGDLSGGDGIYIVCLTPAPSILWNFFTAVI